MIMVRLFQNLKVKVSQTQVYEFSLYGRVLEFHRRQMFLSRSDFRLLLFGSCAGIRPTVCKNGACAIRLDRVQQDRFVGSKFGPCAARSDRVH